MYETPPCRSATNHCQQQVYHSNAMTILNIRQPIQGNILSSNIELATFFG
jgi:hypothetical protein